MTEEPKDSLPTSEQALDARPTHTPWEIEVHELLSRAAKLSAEHGVEVDPFMRGAWSAYVDTRPGLRDYLEELELTKQLNALREAGRIGSA